MWNRTREEGIGWRGTDMAQGKTTSSQRSISSHILSKENKINRQTGAHDNARIRPLSTMQNAKGGRVITPAEQEDLWRMMTQENSSEEAKRKSRLHALKQMDTDSRISRTYSFQGFIVQTLIQSTQMGAHLCKSISNYVKLWEIVAFH